MEVSRAEADVLERLSVFVRFAGRYPVPLTFNETKVRTRADGQKTSPRYFSKDDFETAESMENRLRTRLTIALGDPALP